MIIRPLAESDMTDAYEWYEGQRPGLGEEYLDAVHGALERIKRMPEAPAVVEADIRRVFTHRFPYAVYYRYAQRQAIVVAVLHMRRSPGVWRRRRE